MSKIRPTTITTYGLLGLTGVLTFLLPKTLTVPPSMAADGDDELVLNGVLRDFPKAHVDFNAAPTNGYGHYAGSVNKWLPGSRRPLFVAGGYKVETEWTDSGGHAIAPHLAGVRGTLSRETLGFRVNGKIEVKKDAFIDAFNSNYGPYGLMGNYGQYAFLSTNATDPKKVKIEKKGFIRGDVFVGPAGSPSTVIENKGIITGAQRSLDEAYPMPDLVLPDDLDGYQASLDLSGPVTLTGDVTPDDEVDDPAMHVGDLHIQPGAIVTIEGDLRIRCDRSLTIDKAEVVLAPEANLTFYVSDAGGGHGDVKIKESAVNIDPGDTTLVSINALGTGTLEIDKKSHVYATIVAPQRQLTVKDAAHFYGGFIGESVKAEKKGSGIHVDRGNADLGTTNFALSVRREVKLDDRSTIDSFDSNEGPYGGANVGAQAWVSTNEIQNKEKVEVKNDSEIRGDVMIGPFGDPSKVIKVESGSAITGQIGQLGEPYAIPVVAPPTLGASVGDREYKNGTFSLSADLHCKKLKLDKGILNIAGDVTIRCDDKVEMTKKSEIRLNPGATLTLYVNKEIKLEDKSLINMNTGNPQLVSIRMMSLGKKGKVSIKKQSAVCAWTQGAKCELKVEDMSEYYGSFTGEKIRVKKDSHVHVDMAYLVDCVTVLDSAGTVGADDDGGITSADSFDEWFRTVMGVNQVIGHPITLTRDGAGVWSYLDDSFYPIDDRLLGNEAEAHNNNFTYVIGASFEYSKCGAQFIEFEGGDGVWLFVDNQLVLDLGGVRSPEPQYIELDRLGLDDGTTYQMKLFYAQRQPIDSIFRLRTNVDLNSTKAIPSITAMFD